MKKENFVSLILGTVGGILFALGMCMCLVAEWNAARPGVVLGAVGLAVLLVMLIVRRRMQGKPAIRITGKAVGTVLLAIVGALALGVGMCMTMLWSMMVPGILVGLAGIVLLLDPAGERHTVTPAAGNGAARAAHPRDIHTIHTNKPTWKA